MDRVAFSLFGTEIYWYAVFIVSGMLIAMIIASFLLKSKGYNPDFIIDLAIVILPFSIIGARLYYVLTTLDRGWTISSIVNIRTGGLAIYGGVLLGAVGALLVCKIKKLKLSNILDVLDSIAPGLIIAQAIGRWGNFVNQEAYGNLVTAENLQRFPYAVFIDAKNAWYQATFFYESFFNTIGFIILVIFAFRLAGKYKGLITCGYFFFYGIVRFFIEGLRSDSLYIGDVRASQALSVILVVGAVVGAYFLIKNQKKLQEFTIPENIRLKERDKT